MEEIWKDIPNFENYYEVSTLGNIKSKSRNITNTLGRTYFYESKPLKTQIDRYGYVKVELNKNGKPYYFTIHRLVALTFIPNLKNLDQVNHINAIKTDNRVENLEWCNNQQNITHSWENNLRGANILKGEECNLSKLKEKEVLEIRELHKSGLTMYKIHKLKNVSFQTVSNIVKNKSWKHLN